jgi:putative membrane protein
MTTATTRRFPARLYNVGSEPDPRFTLANERTFLAWIRTSLALTAGGVALEALGQGLQPGVRLAAAIMLIVAGIVTALQAWWGWIHTEQALRRQTPLPSPRLALPVGVALVVVGILILLAIVLA